MITPFDHIFDLPHQPVVIFEDYYLAVLIKPFGYTVEKHSTYPSLEDFFAEKLRASFPGRKTYFVGIAHRLDVSTGGLVVMAKTPQALKHLNKQFEAKTTLKKYLACVEGTITEPVGKLEGFISEDKQQRKSTFSFNQVNGSKKSALHYTVKDQKENFTLLDITLETGRFHQIRASFAFLGHPVVNDERYGAQKVVDQNKTWLCAYSLQVLHPKTNQALHFQL